jgi:AAA family ATP:ADP antiporter
MKDSLILPLLGSEAMSFLELCAVLPSALAFTLIYIKLNVILHNPERIFYLIIGSFLIFFLIFTFVLYPNQDYLHPHPEKVIRLIQKFPNLKWFLLIYGKWTVVFYNIFSELWINAMLSLLFWQFANHITTTKEAKRFYPMLGLIGNLSLICAGLTLKKFALRETTTGVLINSVTITSVILGLVCIALYRYMHVKVLTDPALYQPHVDEVKEKPSFKESIRIISKSRYLWLMAILVIAYGMSINISQGVWKSQVAKLYPTTKQYALFMAGYQQTIGVVSTVFMIVGGYIVRRFSWLTSAIAAPIMMLTTGSIFFTCVIFCEDVKDFLNINALIIAVMLGAAQIILSKSTKFSLFDSTKEMAYIPLGTHLKTKGKAAVDVLGERAGKSGGALLQMVLFTLIPTATYETIAPYLLFIFIIVGLCWIYAVTQLNKEYLERTSDKNI